MARALSNSNLVAALSDGVALLTTRRGYATAAAATTTTTTTGSRERLAVAEQRVKSAPPAGAEEEAACSWVPDPATGYYRPANRMGELDPAELREMLLTRNKSRV
ncbi:Late embryogenesis abundant protein [Musa troglodytarum]|uniref:Late embryogenesis abundant protein n=1 Tax=Musa troglodytarum TaxID=320322 RepID=A0A9E7L1A2_9LILI|nr:Late embryogenesis abundant protein [Musa troglodytarum]